MAISGRDPAGHAASHDHGEHRGHQRRGVRQRPPLHIGEDGQRDDEIDRRHRGAQDIRTPPHAPPGGGEPQQRHHGPEGGGVQAEDAEQRRRAAGVERMQAELQAERARLSHHERQRALVQQQEAADGRGSDDLRQPEGQSVNDADMRLARRLVPHQPPTLDEIAGERGQSQQVEARRQEISRRTEQEPFRPCGRVVQEPGQWHRQREQQPRRRQQGDDGADQQHEHAYVMGGFVRFAQDDGHGDQRQRQEHEHAGAHAVVPGLPESGKRSRRRDGLEQRRFTGRAEQKAIRRHGLAGALVARAQRDRHLCDLEREGRLIAAADLAVACEQVLGGHAAESPALRSDFRDGPDVHEAETGGAGCDEERFGAGDAFVRKVRRPPGPGDGTARGVVDRDRVDVRMRLHDRRHRAEERAGSSHVGPAGQSRTRVGPDLRGRLSECVGKGGEVALHFAGDARERRGLRRAEPGALDEPACAGNGGRQQQAAQDRTTQAPAVDRGRCVGRSPAVGGTTVHDSQNTGAARRQQAAGPVPCRRRCYIDGAGASRPRRYECRSPRPSRPP